MVKAQKLREITDDYIECRMFDLVEGLEASMTYAAHRGKTHYYVSVEKCMVSPITDFLREHGYSVETSCLQPYGDKRSLRVAW